MALLDMLGWTKIPAEARNATLVVGTPDVLGAAEPFLDRLGAVFGPIVLGCFEAPMRDARRVQVALSRRPATLRGLLGKLTPPRLVVLGSLPEAPPLIEAAGCPIVWINADAGAAALAERVELMTIADPRLQGTLPAAVLTGDPLLGVEPSPDASEDADLCARFKEHHEAGRWVGYFASTVEGEEPLAYAVFFQLVRRRMGLLALAPRDAERYEPVYRDALKYRLPTNRHNRLSTSFVPIKTRVYYIEDPATCKAMYGCADFVVPGATLNPDATQAPDLLTPLLLGRPVIMGPAYARDVLARAAAAAEAALVGHNEEELVAAAARVVGEPAFAAELGRVGKAWIMAQMGAAERVLNLLSRQVRRGA